MAWQICFWNYLTFNSVWKKNLLMKIQTFRNLLSTQHASNLCFSSQACQLTMGKIYKNKKDPHLTLAEKNNIKRREKCFVTKIVLTYCEKKNVLVIEKNFWNSRLKAENLHNFWDHKNNFLVRPSKVLVRKEFLFPDKNSFFQKRFSFSRQEFYKWKV